MIIEAHLLKFLRRIYSVLNPESSSFGRNWKMYPSKEYANDLIFNTLIKRGPVMVSRFGAFELNCLVNYIGIKESKGAYKDYIRGKSPEWWWNKTMINFLHTNAGFFPKEEKKIVQFCELMLKDIQEIDILGTWLKEERFVQKGLTQAKRVILEDLEPFFSKNPWTKALESKKVLVVHPFSETIEEQYKKRTLLFDNNLLPDFNLKTIKSVQSISGIETGFADWFEALEYMKTQIDSVDYDICIIGAGAYGLPLAAHVKRKGKQSVHLGGATQLLFGIKGRRWVDNPMLYYPYVNLFNNHWIYPLGVNKPPKADKVEDACYW